MNYSLGVDPKVALVRFHVIEKKNPLFFIFFIFIVNISTMRVPFGKL